MSFTLKDQQGTQLVRGNNKQAFSLLEIMVVIAVIGILATIVVPVFNRRRPGYERNQFVVQLNDLLSFAYQNALKEHKIQKVQFNFKARTVQLERATEQSSGTDKLKFEPIQRAYRATTLAIPDALEIRNFIIEGFDEMQRASGRATDESWFYILPDGASQEVTINFVDSSSAVGDGEFRQTGLVLNPFYAQFEVYDEFQE